MIVSQRWPRQAEVALNQAVQSMDDRPVLRWGHVVLRRIDGPKYAVSAQHNHRRVGLLLHQPLSLWRAEVEYPANWTGPRPPAIPRIGARYWCGQTCTLTAPQDDPRTPNTVLCVRCIEAIDLAARKAEARRVIDLIRHGAALAPF